MKEITVSADTILWLMALIAFVFAAYGTAKGRPVLIACGWIGLALIALTVIL